MSQADSIESRIAQNYGALSEKLRVAADYVVENPLDVATRSLRALSGASDVSPATFSRLARALDFDSFEHMREAFRIKMSDNVLTFSEKAERLRRESNAQTTMLERQSMACIANIEALVRGTDEAQLNAAAKALASARAVKLFGALGSTGVVEYLAYLANYFAPNWSLTGRTGASLGADLAALGKGDVLFVVTKTPHVRRAVMAAKMAKKAGACVILITDFHFCPALPHADHSFIVASESPQFFSSYVATLVLIEALIAMIIASSPDDSTEAIRRVEHQNRALNEYWAED